MMTANDDQRAWVLRVLGVAVDRVDASVVQGADASAVEGSDAGAVEAAHASAVEGSDASAVEATDASVVVPALEPGQLLPLWIEAKEATDAGIEQLQRALRAVNDPDFHHIADYGLNGATTGQSTKLVVALREVNREASPQNRAKLESAVQAFRDFLAGSPIVALLEDNPFGVAVPIRSKLGPALDEIQRSIAA